MGQRSCFIHFSFQISLITGRSVSVMDRAIFNIHGRHSLSELENFPYLQQENIFSFNTLGKKLTRVLIGLS